ncbi:hypothetical protein DWB88_13570 (plasmid) [Staphylococcus warneri]|nr:hypothetical protein DWB88_13570 [Staphylococcus warneri]
MTVNHNHSKDINVNVNLQNQGHTLQAIKEFLFYEYDTEFNSLEDMAKTFMTDTLTIPLAHTTFEDDEDIQIQVYLELKYQKLTKRVTGSNTLAHEEVEFFKNEEEMLEAIQYFTFDELVSLKADTDWLIQILK